MEPLGDDGRMVFVSLRLGRCSLAALMLSLIVTLVPRGCCLAEQQETAPSPQTGAEAMPAPTFTNPILRTGPDPWVIRWNGFYYVTFSNGHNLRLWKTQDITDLRHAERRVVWTPPPDTEYSEQLWAPELHRLHDRWYLYFAADDGENRHHHIYVLENASDDPMEGDWTFKGMVTDPSYRWAIDPSILSLNGRDYLLWSGWPDTKNIVQNLYIAQLSNPWTIQGHRSLISKPEHDWEKHVEIGDSKIDIPRHGVNKRLLDRQLRAGDADAQAGQRSDEARLVGQNG